MRRPAPLPRELLDADGFTRREAENAGVDQERLRRRDLVRPFHGVRAVEAPVTLADHARAYAARLEPDGFLSHTSAAALWGLPLPRRLDPRIHVSQPHGHRAVRTRGVIGHHLVISDRELTVLDGIPITTPERTWSDLAGWIDLEALVAAGDRVIWHRAPLAHLDALVEVARRHPGRRGRPARLAALALVSDRADSAPESVLRVRIARSGLPTPLANPLLRTASGAWVGQPDLAWPEYREVVEYEGDGHRTDRAQWRTDLRRVPRFEDDGWHVNRAGGDDLADGSRWLLRLLARRLRAKGWNGELRL